MKLWATRDRAGDQSPWKVWPASLIIIRPSISCQTPINPQPIMLPSCAARNNTITSEETIQQIGFGKYSWETSVSGVIEGNMLIFCI